MKTLNEVRKEFPSLRLNGKEVTDVKYDPSHKDADEEGYVETVVDTVVVRGMSMTTVQYTVDFPETKVVDMLKLCIIHPTADEAVKFFPDRPTLVAELWEMVLQLSQGAAKKKTPTP